MRSALQEAFAGPGAQPEALILESNSLMQFLKPSLYFAVIDPAREDFKESARAALDRADALVVRRPMESLVAAPPWVKLPAAVLRMKPSVFQREGEPLPEPLHALIERVLNAAPTVPL